MSAIIQGLSAVRIASPWITIAPGIKLAIRVRPLDWLLQSSKAVWCQGRLLMIEVVPFFARDFRSLLRFRRLTFPRARQSQIANVVWDGSDVRAQGSVISTIRCVLPACSQASCRPTQPCQCVASFASFASLASFASPASCAKSWTEV